MALALVLPSTGWARTEPLRFEVEGTQFVVDGAEGMAGFAESAATVVRAEWPRVATAIGAPAGETIQVHLEHAFNDWFEREGVPSTPPEWAVGLALPARRVILLIPGNATWEATLAHEMTHVAVAIAAGDGHVPTWFTEGIAVAVAEQWGLQRMQTMVQAALTGSVHDFRALENGWPPSSSLADLAYAQSFHFVRWVREAHGDDVFSRILGRVRTGEAWGAAFRAETGELQTVAYDGWRRQVKVGYAWIPIVMGSGVGGLATVALVFAGWRRRTRTQRTRLAAMARREQSQYGSDPDDETFR